MATEQQKPLTHEDTLSAEEIYRTRHDITDETAQELGYPNARLYVMERELEDLAIQINRTRDTSLLKAYHLLYYKMIAFGMHPDHFDAYTELDEDLMPELPEPVAAGDRE